MLDSVKKNILRILLYYDIFRHPLKPYEIFSLLPQNSISLSELNNILEDHILSNHISFKEGYYFVGQNDSYVDLRNKKEFFSKRAWTYARIVTHIIKRFPFVRAVFVTGSLSKNSSLPNSDLDFMVVTKSNRLWVCRTLLMLFKKLFLLNSYKYFCINYFISEDSLEIEEKNIFTATEIVHIKSTYNTDLMKKFLEFNKSWLKKYFPNYRSGDPYFHSSGFKVNNKISYLQKMLEVFFSGKPGGKLDSYLRDITRAHWNKKYFYINKNEREHMFKSTINVSKAHPGNMQKVILNKYKERLKNFNLNYQGKNE